MSSSSKNQQQDGEQVSGKKCVKLAPASKSSCQSRREEKTEQQQQQTNKMTQKEDTTLNTCAACQRPIRERYLLVALDKQWHEDCLKCACCDCRLGEVGNTLFTHSGKILCRRDFLRIFGLAGRCAACQKPIPPYEMVMRANENAYHMDCFACQLCQYRFCVGDRFHLWHGGIVCTICYAEQSKPANSNPEPADNKPEPVKGGDEAGAM